jgi:hypothetical protein
LEAGERGMHVFPQRNSAFISVENHDE